MKINKLLVNFTSKDSIRRNLNGVLLKDGKAIATDGHRLVVVPYSYDAKLEGQVVYSDLLAKGELAPMDAKYPNVTPLFPKPSELGEPIEIKIPEWVRVIAKSRKPVTVCLNRDGVLSLTKQDDTLIGFNLKYLAEWAGETVSVRLCEVSPSHRPMVVNHDAVETVLIMPVRL